MDSVSDIREGLNKMKNRVFKIKEGELIVPHNSFLDPFTLPDTVKRNPLMEGYYRTYPPEKVKSFLEKRYRGGNFNIFLLDAMNNERCFCVRFPDNDENQEMIDQDMRLCGYFPSYIEKIGDKREVQYEPRRQNQINDIVQDEEYIYHLTQANKVQKILNIGLTPKTNNKKFVYPDRIYFFLHEPEYDECVSFARQFYASDMIQVGLGKKKREDVYDGTYTLLRIDTEKVKYVDFSYDPNGDECIYTYDNIKPDAIEVHLENIGIKYIGK